MGVVVKVSTSRRQEAAPGTCLLAVICVNDG